MNTQSRLEPASPAGGGVGFWSRVGQVFVFRLAVYDDVATSPASLHPIGVLALAATLSFGLFSIALFFVFIPVALVGLALPALLVRVASALLGGKTRSWGEWYRALALAEAPAMIGIVPVVGTFVGGVYCIATLVAAVSQLADVSILRAIVTVVVAVLLPVVLLAAPIASFGLVGLLDPGGLGVN